MRTRGTTLVGLVAAAIAFAPVPAVAEPHVTIKYGVAKHKLGQRAVVVYDIRNDETPGAVKVVVKRVDGGYRSVFKGRSFVREGEKRVRLDRLRLPGEYSVKIEWQGRTQGAGAGKYFNVSRGIQ